MNNEENTISLDINGYWVVLPTKVVYVVEVTDEPFVKIEKGGISEAGFYEESWYEVLPKGETEHQLVQGNRIYPKENELKANFQCQLDLMEAISVLQKREYSIHFTNSNLVEETAGNGGD